VGNIWAAEWGQLTGPGRHKKHQASTEMTLLLIEPQLIGRFRCTQAAWSKPAAMSGQTLPARAPMLWVRCITAVHVWLQ